jgi:lipoprotein-releasing system permease protein
MLEYDDDISAIEVKLNRGANLSKTKTEIKNIFGTRYKVADRQEQHEFLYKVLKSEKWAIFMIMVFIVLIASFNIVGSLTMLIIDKKKDINILKSLGAESKTIRRVFFLQGMFISLIGALTGLIIGGAICYIQQTYEIITLGKGGSYIINAYPVLMKGLDFVAVFGAVMLIGFLASWYPVKYLTGKFTKNDFKD